MPTLTASQMSALRTKINNGDIAGFYSNLRGYGDSYGSLGLSVTNNTGWQGELANNFIQSGAGNNNVDMSYGSMAWTNLNNALANAYLSAYEVNGGAQPTRSQIQDAHALAYQGAGLDPDDWFPNRMLNQSGDPDALWADYMNNTSPADLWQDMIGVAERTKPRRELIAA